MNIETKCVQSGYSPSNGEPRVLPIYQSTTFKYDSASDVGDLFDLKKSGHMYSRISNPTNECVEKKIADLENGVGALLTSSGQSAFMTVALNLCTCSSHILMSKYIYGGTNNLALMSLKNLGIEVTLVDSDLSLEELMKYVLPNTKFIFAETISNPTLNILDIEKFAILAHKNNIPLVLDNTFATPYLCNPIDLGADIVIHSTSKYLDGHAVSLGGVIVDSGKFDYTNGKFPSFTTPDESYHGLVYTKDFAACPFIAKARVQLMRDLGVAMSPFNAFILNLGIETLHLRMKQHCDNALKVAEYLESSVKVLSVNYPLLKNNKYYDLCKKYMPKGASGVIAFKIRGDKADCIKFLDRLKLLKIVVHVADTRSSALHPASMTHRQLSKLQLEEAGISENLIRLSIGIENIDDILNDIKNALAFI